MSEIPETQAPIESIPMASEVAIEPKVAKKKGREPKWGPIFEKMNIGDHFMAKNRGEANSARTSGHVYFKYRFKTKKQQDGQVRVERVV